MRLGEYRAALIIWFMVPLRLATPGPSGATWRGAWRLAPAGPSGATWRGPLCSLQHLVPDGRACALCCVLGYSSKLQSLGGVVGFSANPKRCIVGCSARDTARALLLSVRLSVVCLGLAFGTRVGACMRHSALVCAQAPVGFYWWSLCRVQIGTVVSRLLLVSAHRVSVCAAAVRLCGIWLYLRAVSVLGC